MAAASPVSSDVFAGVNGPYATIVADPPWAYRTTTGITTRTSHGTACAEDNYSTMTNAEIAALPVADLAADHAHLYLWVTNPKMYGGRKDEMNPAQIMEAWGFRYITCITWLKQPAALGMGFYFRGQTEHVLFGVRGKLGIPPEKRERNHLTAATTGHSRKPAAFFDMVERVSPGPYLELFCREPRMGWDSWGHGYETKAS